MNTRLPATSRVSLSYDVAPWGYHQILRSPSQREVHMLRSVRMDYSDWGLICGPTRHLFWLMLSLAPITQPLALTINPGWLLIGAQGDIEEEEGGLSHAVYQNLPNCSRLICGFVSAPWLTSWNPLGWKTLVASQIYQDCTHWHTGTHIKYSKELSVGILEKYYS